MIFPQFSTYVLCQVMLAATRLLNISADAITSITSSVLYQHERQVANTAQLKRISVKHNTGNTIEEKDVYEQNRCIVQLVYDS